MLQNRVAIITNATKGIGRTIAMTLAKNGYNIVVACESIKQDGQLPGTIHCVSEKIKKYGITILPYKIDIHNSGSLNNLVKTTIKYFGRIDILINNPDALWWKSMLKIPVKKYDSINNVNSRAAYTLSQLCLPHMLKNNWGHIIMQSPPLTPKYINNLIKTKKINYKTAYMTSKFGMSITALGISQELQGTKVAANTLWPMTPIENFALINKDLGTKEQWRKPEIISDSIMHILQEDPNDFTGNCLIDEDYLRTKGVNDFSKYQCVPGHEPPKLNELKGVQSFIK